MDPELLRHVAAYLDIANMPIADRIGEVLRFLDSQPAYLYGYYRERKNETVNTMTEQGAIAAVRTAKGGIMDEDLKAQVVEKVLEVVGYGNPVQPGGEIKTFKLS